MKVTITGQKFFVALGYNIKLTGFSFLIIEGLQC